MALAAFNGQAQDESGNVVTSFQVEVKRESSGAPLASIYSDREGATPLGNPFTPDPIDNGQFRFHVVGGAYRIRIFDGSGFEKIWRYVSIGRAGESDDVIQFPGYLMAFEALTTEGVSAPGGLRANHANLSLATFLYISTSNVDGFDLTDRLQELGNPLKTVRDKIVLTQSDGSQASFNVVSSALGLGSPTDYYKVAVTAHEGATSLSDGSPLSMVPILSGFDGAAGAAGNNGTGDMNGPGAATVGQFASFNATSGKLLRGETLSDSPSTPVILGGDAGVRAATPGGLIHAGLIESASVEVALTDGATISLDWDTGINFGVTLQGTRTLGNPTNGQPGTYRTVRVQGDATASPSIPRSLAFGTQYLGDVPAISDAADDRWYLVTIFCITSTHFSATSRRVK